jgi:hypothetical protein
MFLILHNLPGTVICFLSALWSYIRHKRPKYRILPQKAIRITCPREKAIGTYNELISIGPELMQSSGRPHKKAGNDLFIPNLKLRETCPPQGTCQPTRQSP